MVMQLQTAQRTMVKIKMGIQGPSGLEKTNLALLLDSGLSSAWDKIAVIDTENNFSLVRGAETLNLTIKQVIPDRFSLLMTRIC